MRVSSSEGLHAHYSTTRAPSYTSAPQHSLSTQVFDAPIQSLQYEQGWNARRAQARIQLKQTVASTIAQREPPGHSTYAITLSTLPRMSPSPLAQSRAVHDRTDSGERYLPRNNHPTSNPPQLLERPSSVGGTTGQADRYSLDTRSSRHLRTDSSSYHSGRDSAIRRPRSGCSDQSYTLQAIPPMRTMLPSPYQHHYPNVAFHQHQYDIAVGQSARSMNSKTVPASRTSSLPIYNMMVDTHSPRSSPRPKPQRYYSQVERAHIESLAALTASSHEHTSNHRRSPPVVTFTHESWLNANPHYEYVKHPISNQQHSRSRSSATIPHRVRSPPQKDRAMSVDMATYTQSLEKRAMPSRENLTMWKLERETAKLGFADKHRALVKERVRRANELESEKEKELMMIREMSADEDEKGSEKEGGCLSGLFRRFRLGKK
ncbi:hypothetical protein P153DRAFT_337091 [Dothidotthia symphoricarpi CBS 119687]|uniref:Uncharacterized protein n=1 Tax=Dothidotthia symphoricarpi CBS 119687 TaxID=1392245 RepID=A0A6A6AIR9_9PLEO|nr:uncharacterized protein P153DRAFT_337091 [Dothidotthia symphoricarpi CBS 119687]KAF2130988.1 hypothetical protein P153DRAFT_337091 [Dothidotthia symphoricarpi CBS 119687]